MFEASGYTFVVETELYEKGKPFTVDMTYMGLTVNSSLELGGGGCGSSCSGGSCSTS